MKNVLCIMLLIGGFVVADELVKQDSKNTPITVYMIRNGDTDRTIHRVFLTEKAAKRYVNDYKESHAYEYEAVLLTE
jgi:hypothetical protein